MVKLRQIFLPGTDKQFLLFSEKAGITGKSVLIAGAGTEEIAKAFAGINNDVIVIVEDQENLIQLKYAIAGAGNISVRMMDFDNTDFKNDRFDIIYAQASVSGKKRNKISKEFKKILKTGGIYCVGEIVNIKKNIPQFIIDIWEQSGLAPLFTDELATYYTEKGFKVLSEEDLSYTLKDFYLNSSARLKQTSEMLSDKEQSYYKKLLKQISHESNAYLRLGGNEYMGYKMLILEKI